MITRLIGYVKENIKDIEFFFKYQDIYIHSIYVYMFHRISIVPKAPYHPPRDN